MNRNFPLTVLVLLAGSLQSAAAADGRALYEATCIACHGARGQGAVPGVPDLTNGVRLAKPDAELEANILNGFQSKGSPMAMPPKGGNPNLTASDIHALVIYLRSLTAAPPSPSAVAANQPLAPAPDKAQPAPPSDMQAFARGAKAWGENCARCHGMRDPKEFSDRQWKVITTHMRLRAGLDGQQVRDITVFLQGSN